MTLESLERLQSICFNHDELFDDNAHSCFVPNDYDTESFKTFVKKACLFIESAPNVQDLIITGFNSESAIKILWAIIERLPNLRRLSLFGNILGAPQVDEILDILEEKEALEPLEVLDLRENHYLEDDEGAHDYIRSTVDSHIQILFGTLWDYKTY